MIDVLTLWESLQSSSPTPWGVPRLSLSPRAPYELFHLPWWGRDAPGWHPGMPARGREGHLVCQSLEHQHLPYSLNSPGIFSPALMWRPLTALQCPHSTRCTELCVLWCPVSSKAFKPPRKKFSISLLAQTRGLYTCSAFPHFLMRCVQGILDEYGIHTLCVM